MRPDQMPCAAKTISGAVVGDIIDIGRVVVGVVLNADTSEHLIGNAFGYRKCLAHVVRDVVMDHRAVIAEHILILWIKGNSIGWLRQLFAFEMKQYLPRHGLFNVLP